MMPPLPPGQPRPRCELALQGNWVEIALAGCCLCAAWHRYCKTALHHCTEQVAPKFETMDLESCSGRYHTVCCLDVMIHYPTDKMEGMVQHLASLAGELR